MKVLDMIDIKDIATIMLSVSAGDALMGDDPLAAKELTINAVYTLLYSFMRKKNPYASESETKYYAMAIAQSIIASGFGALSAVLLGESKGDIKLKHVAKDGLVKYVEVFIGESLKNTFIDDTNIEQ